MTDVARHAGVPPLSVSRVTQGQGYVSDEKRQRVQAAMKELDYRPNAAARAMKHGAFKTIGVYYHSLHDVGGRHVLEAIVTAAAEHAYGTTLAPLTASGGRRAELSVDAAIDIVFTSGQVAKFREPGMQVLLGFKHTLYGHLAVVPEATRAELAKDFA